jgi:hypothetical protein
VCRGFESLLRYQCFQWISFAAELLPRGVSAPSQHAAEKQPFGWAVHPLISPRFMRPLPTFHFEPAARLSDPACAAATGRRRAFDRLSTATTRTADHRPSRTSLGPREKNPDRPFFSFCTEKIYALCGNCLNLEFGLIQPFAAIEHQF